MSRLWLVKFLYRQYVILWLRWRGYHPATAGEYIRALKKEA